MGSAQITASLAEGIDAAKKGEAERARALLLQVIEADEKNEQAWLWLSAVVQKEADRRICLENVLTINPSNAAARRGLEKLDRAEDGETASATEQVVRVESMPVSPAAAVLYPERQQKRWRWHDRVPLQQAPIASYKSQSEFDDIWEGEGDICAYCAESLDDDRARCPKCKRNLVASKFRYPRASANLLVFLVLLLGVAQLFFVQALLDIVMSQPLLTAAWHACLFAVVVALAAGVYLRQFWSYAATIVALLLIGSYILINLLTDSAVDNALGTLTPEEYFQTLAASPFLTLASPLLEFVQPLQLVAVLLAFGYAVLQVGPDFEREKARLVARTAKGLHDATQYYSAGKEYAEQEMWASAALNWRRASALDPSRSYYLRRLGEAYAKLGFYERSLDVLESALLTATSPEAKAETQKEIAEVKSVQVAKTPTLPVS